MAEGEKAPAGGAGARGWLKAEVPMAFEVLGLTGLVVTQPVLEVFQHSADVFVLRRAGAFEIVVFALVVALVPAGVLWGVGALSRLAGAAVRKGVHAATLGGLGAILAIEVAKDLTDLGRTGLLVVAGVAGVAVVAAVWRWAPARLLPRYVAVAVPLYVGLFLFASPVAPLVTTTPAAAADVTVDDPAPVVMVVLDELPTVSLLDGDGAIDAERFPAFASLAADATWYRNHSTVAPLTPSAVPAILTGELPEGEGVVPVAAAHPQSIFTLLAGTYDVHATETLTQVCPSSVCGSAGPTSSRAVVHSLVDNATQVWRDVASPSAYGPVEFTVSDQWFDTGAATRLGELEASLAPSGDRPRFDFLHVLLPHQPWRFLPDGSTYEAPNPPTGAPFVSVWGDQHAADVARLRHTLQLQYADRSLGAVLDRLHELGTYDESLIVVTADHGVAFTQDSAMRGVSADNYEEILWTPLLVKAPGQAEGEVDDVPMQTIDILPTVAAMLGVDLPDEVDGVPAGERRAGSASDERQILDYRFHDLHPTGDDDFVRFDGEEGFARVLAHDPLGEPGGGLGPYRVGPDADLIGWPLDALGGPTVGEPVATTAAVATTGAYVSGTVAADPPTRLALVIDGEVTATPTAYQEAPGDSQFFAMVPDRWRVDDPDEVEVYVVTGDGDRRVLHPVGG